MQAILLDTHVWLWLLLDEREHTSIRTWRTLEQAAERNALAVSEVSFWEVAVKAAKGKLDLPPNTRDWLKRATLTPGLGIIEIDREVMVDSVEVDVRTGDPVDRMLAATALRYDLQLATADKALLDYARRNERFSVLDCTTRV